jgi:hypothetical protein
MDFGYELIIGTLKLLKWIEEKLPDKPRLGLTLLAIGAVSVGLTLLLPSQEDWRIEFAAPIFAGYLAGGTCGVLGSYILFRRAVWIWQDKRAPRITTLRLK